MVWKFHWVNLTILLLSQFEFSFAFKAQTPHVVDEATAQGQCGDKHEGRCTVSLQLLQQQRRVRNTQSISNRERGRVSTSNQMVASALGTATVVQHSEVLFSGDGRFATVSFAHNGELHSYNLSAFTVFASNAEASIHTKEGALPLNISQSRTFRSRKVGSWASATLFANGTIYGLFQDKIGAILQLRPLSRQDLSGLIRHEKQSVSLLDIFQPRTPVTPMISARNDEDTPFVKTIDQDPTRHWPPSNVDSVSEDSIEAGLWLGQSWWPGCYDGDDALHDVVVGFIADQAAWQDHGPNLQIMLENALAEASFIYEMQMNVRLVLGYLKMYQSADNAPSYVVGCPSGDELMDAKLDQLTDNGADYPFQGAMHLFTGCGDNSGTVGVSWTAALCDKYGYNTGVSQVHDYSVWLTFAHELGHNFGAEHAFQEGIGKTGGIMDYGDGKLDGVYQFNTKYAKADVCKVVNSIVNDCQDKFVISQVVP